MRLDMCVVLDEKRMMKIIGNSPNGILQLLIHHGCFHEKKQFTFLSTIVLLLLFELKSYKSIAIK